MKRFRAFSVTTVLLMLGSLGLSACGGDPTATPVIPTATPKPVPTATTPPPQSREATDTEAALIKEVLEGAKDLKSYHFNIEIKPSEFITQPIKAEGDYQAPDMTYVKGTVGKESFENIVVGDTVFEKNSSGDYVLKEETSANPSDPTAIFSPDTIINSGNPLGGLGDMTGQGITKFNYVGDAQIEGVRTKHYTFDLDIEEMMAAEGMQDFDASGLDLGGGGFYIDENAKKLYGFEVNLNLGAYIELLTRAFSGLMGTPTPGGAKPTPLPKLELNMIMKITKHNDPSIRVPVTDEMRAMMEEEPTEEPTEEIEATPFAEETPEEFATAEAESTPEAFPTIPGLPQGDGQVHEGKVGEAVNVGWSRLTVNSAKRASGGVIAPAAGKEYLIVNVTVENVGEAEPQNVSSLLMFKLRDSADKELDQSFFADSPKPIDSESPNPLEKGDKITGDIAYEIDKGATGLSLEFFPYPFFDEKTKAKVDLD